MKLTDIQQQAIQARMSLIVSAENFDRLFLGAVFSEIANKILTYLPRPKASRPRSRKNTRCTCRSSPARAVAQNQDYCNSDFRLQNEGF
jgi:hypothetical protein